MSPIFITSIIGLAIGVATLSQVAPSVAQMYEARAAQNNIAREELLLQQIVQYRQNEGSYPGSMTDLISRNYWRASDNVNAHGGAYSFSIDAARGYITISTTIPDALSRAAYIANSKHVFKPRDVGAGVVSTSFVIPSAGSGATNATALASNTVVTGATAPDPAATRYWYDTSGSDAVMRVSNGSQWLAATTLSAQSRTTAFDTSKVVGSPADLPAVASNGDVRYVFNNGSNTLETIVYFDGGWRQAVTGGSLPAAGVIRTFLQSPNFGVIWAGEPFSYDLKNSFSAFNSSDLTPVAVNPSDIRWTALTALPSGLSLNESTGIASGAPTSVDSRASSGKSFSVLATYGGSTSQQVFTIKVGPSILRATQVVSGEAHNCALMPNGGVKCWGRNISGQLGNGTTTQSDSPVDVMNLPAPAYRLAASSETSCAALTDGRLMCWGGNGSGQLGDGTLVSKSIPTQVSGLTSGVIDVAAGAAHTCALRTPGRVWCWGANGVGQVGSGSNTPSRYTTPYEIAAFSGVTSLSAGNDFSCMVAGGAARCWGNNLNGQLGDNSTINKYNPVAVSGLTAGVSTVSVGSSHACAVMTAGGIKCWGDGASGKLGNGATTASRIPVDVASGGVLFSSVATGQDHTCATTRAGSAMCWGANPWGQVGVANTGTSYPTPQTVASMGANVKSVSSGYKHSCLTTTTDRVHCWGENFSKQLGPEGPTSPPQSQVPIPILSTRWL